MATSQASWGHYLARGADPLPFDIDDLLGSERTVLDEAQAEALATALAGHQGCQKIRLSGKSFTAAAATRVARALAALPTLTEVDLSDVIASRPEEEGLEVLRLLSGGLLAAKSGLTALNLSDNALGEKGLRACAALLDDFAALRKLWLCNNGLSAEACTHLVDVLMFRGPETTVPLTVFEFHDNMCGDAGGVNLSRLVARLGEVESFRFSKTRCGREGCEAIAEALGACVALTHANFEDITFGAEGSSRLARSLANCPRLVHLNLRDAMLEEEGTEELLDMLEEHAPQLAFLDISGNDLTAESMQKVVATLQAKPQLAYLGLDDNDLGNAGALVLAKALASAKQFPALKELSCRTCDLTTAGAVVLVRTAVRKPLQQVLLNGNGISEEGLATCAALLEGKGGNGVLGSLEDNDEDMEEEDDDEDVEAIRIFEAGLDHSAADATEEIAGMLEGVHI